MPYQSINSALNTLEKRTVYFITKIPTWAWAVFLVFFLGFMFWFLKSNYLEAGLEKALVSPAYQSTVKPLLESNNYIVENIAVGDDYSIFELVKSELNIAGFSLFVTVEQVSDGRRMLVHEAGDKPDPSLAASYQSKVPLKFGNREAHMTIYPNIELLGLEKNARNQALKAIAFTIVLLIPLILIRLILYRYIETWLRSLIDGMSAYVENQTEALDFKAQLEKTRHGHSLTYIQWQSFIRLEKDILKAGIELKKTRDELKQSLEERERIKIENDRQSELRNMADQVAHDIKKPLLVLETIQEEMVKGTLDKGLLTELLRDSRRRIKVLINNYSQMSREGLAFDPEEGMSEHMAWVLLAKQVYHEQLVLPKEINIHLHPVHWGAWISVNADGFKNVISNLINNARDALGESGDITLSVEVSDDQVTVIIRDNGVGMPPKFLAKAMDRGVTRKAAGAGLGLAQAKEFMEGCDGDIRLESVEGQGTTVYLTLPKQNAPLWSIQYLAVGKGSTVVILDDQDKNHQAWGRRFEEISPNADQFEEEYFYSVAQFEKWFDGKTKNQCLFLVDYLLGEGPNGLDVIRNHGLEDNTILVTSISDDANIRRHCEKLNVPLLPKELIPHIRLLLDAGETTLEIEGN